jgi:predicted metal-dependent hydrolase
MKLKFEYKNEVIKYELVRRKRKTICIKINEDGEVIISAPLRTSTQYILLVIKNRADWILERQKEVKLRGLNKVKRDFTEGNTFMYLGEEYPLYLDFDERRKRIKVELNEQLKIYTNTMDIDKLKLALEKWYRSETLKIVTQRIDYYARNFKDKVTNIRVKEQKRRWASCTGKNAILFNWRCSMARADVIDYIVVHEMCHMDHRNHSKYFWNRVSEIMPDYKEKHEWLRVHGMNLYF